MTNQRKFEGTLSALCACCDDEGQVSSKRTTALCRPLLKKGVKGLYAGASSGKCICKTVLVTHPYSLAGG